MRVVNEFTSLAASSTEVEFYAEIRLKLCRVHFQSLARVGAIKTRRACELSLGLYNRLRQTKIESLSAA